VYKYCLSILTTSKLRSLSVWFCVVSAGVKTSFFPPCLLVVAVLCGTGAFFLARRTCRISKVKVKVIPQEAEVAQGVPGRLRPRIFLTFDTTRVVGRQPYAPAAFTPGAESTPGHMVAPGGATEKIPSDTTGNRSRDLPTSSAVP